MAILHLGGARRPLVQLPLGTCQFSFDCTVAWCDWIRLELVRFMYCTSLLYATDRLHPCISYFLTIDPPSLFCC